MSESVPTETATDYHNVPAYTVSEISQSVKRTIEDQYGWVRVRGEISRPSFPGSGHIYLTLKDDKSTLAAVCWRGTAGRLSVKPEEGLEVIVTGRMTTFPGQSKYQLIIERMEVAGEGALLKLLEERKKKLAAEGLFAEDRKRPLPFLPERIGVVTSPTGAVIRDILHRVSDRFPRPVLVWPSRVQGEGAAKEIAAAIRGFHHLPADKRPDVLIVARGGGSLEDLWAFNEEEVVRAVAEADIPLISAVGHETDTTLIDYAADRRAPTPTAAAEMAVPVRTELLLQVQDLSGRLEMAPHRLLQERQTTLTHLARALGDPMRLLEERQQHLDLWEERLQQGRLGLFTRCNDHLARLAAGLRHPKEVLAWGQQGLEALARRLAPLPARLLHASDQKQRTLAARLSPRILARKTQEGTQTLAHWGQRLTRDQEQRLQDAETSLAHLGRLLKSFSHEQVLERGFALVHDDQGKLVRTAAAIDPGQALSLTFKDGQKAVQSLAAGQGGDSAPKKPRRTAKPKTPDQRQGKLF